MRPCAPVRPVTPRTGDPRPPSPFSERELSLGANQLYAGEEVGALEAGGLGCVRPMDAVGLDRRGEVTADRARGGLGGVGRAHDLPQAGDGVLALEDHRDAGPRAHEIAEAAEEGPLAVDVV